MSSAVLVAAGLGGDVPGPAATDLVAARSRVALQAVDALEAALAPAVRGARQAASLVVAGDEPPGPSLVSAAATLEVARDEAVAVTVAVAALDSARLAVDPSAQPLGSGPDAGRLERIAADLRSATIAADTFAAMRHRTTDLLDAVDRALGAVEATRFDDARREVELARAHHEALSAWSGASDALPVWLGTTDAMIRAVERLIDATEARDEAAASSAEAELGRIVQDAATADRALRIAISEGGGPLLGAEIQQLADAAESLERLRDAIRAEAAP